MADLPDCASAPREGWLCACAAPQQPSRHATARAWLWNPPLVRGCQSEESTPPPPARWPHHLRRCDVVVTVVTVVTVLVDGVAPDHGMAGPPSPPWPRVGPPTWPRPAVDRHPMPTGHHACLPRLANQPTPPSHGGADAAAAAAAAAARLAAAAVDSRLFRVHIAAQRGQQRGWRGVRLRQRAATRYPGPKIVVP
jgi:hypothetical protein